MAETMAPAGSGRIEHVVIVGGGTAGWMAAAALATHLKGTGTAITLVESSEIGTVGVGEATIPTIRRFYAALGMRDADVIAATQATAKLGIRFFDWLRPGHSFVHPFGRFGEDLRGVDFHHYWLAARARGEEAPIEEFSLGAMLAREGHASTPAPQVQTQLSVFDWALHLDATLFAQHLRRHAEAEGCTRIDGRIVSVEMRPNGFVAGVTLEDGRAIEGDLFIDCSGFRGLVIGEALGVRHEDWSHWLLCDGAWAVQSAAGPDLPSYTSVTARSAGWQWRIPLQHREGNGIVFSSRHQPEEDARAELLAQMRGKPTGEPRRLRFRPGRRAQAWSRNCVALGLAAGFLEPLESTSIALIETGIERLKQLFPDKSFDPMVIDEYNENSAREMERVRDFLILHYKLNGREGAFWEQCRKMPVPESLERKLALWRARGHFLRYRWEMFSPASWLAILAGYEDMPRSHDPAVEAIDGPVLKRLMDGMRAAVARTVADTPTHAEFLAMIARSRDPQRPRVPA